MEEPVPEGHKRCTKCSEVKPSEEFYKNMARCKRCSLADNKAHYEARKAKV